MKRIIAVTMVKNESDIIESFIRHAFTYIDGMIIYDDNSIDQTPVIIQNLIAEGFNIKLVSGEIKAVFFLQADIMNLLIKEALITFSADIILPIDTDEFLIPAPGYEHINVRAVLEQIPDSGDNVYAALWTHFIPTVFARDNSVFLPCYCDKYYEYIPDYISEISNKVIISADVIKRTRCGINKGNHNMYLPDDRGLLNKITIPELTLAHIPFRSVPQLIIKTIIVCANRQLALAKNSDETERIRLKAMTGNYAHLYDILKKEGNLTTKHLWHAVSKLFHNQYREDPVYDIRDYKWDDCGITLKYTDYKHSRDNVWKAVLSCYEDMLAEANIKSEAGI